MGFVFDVLTAPVLGPIRGIHWLGEKLYETAQAELLDEGKVRAQLFDLQTLYDLGEVSEEEYDEGEGVLLERLNAIREAKAGRAK